DLAPEVSLAGLNLLRHRIAVAGKPAFQDIRDVDLVPAQADPRKQLLEPLSGGADERNSLLVLVKPWCLTDEHELGIRIAGAEDDLRAACRERAPGAAGDLISEGG